MDITLPNYHDGSIVNLMSSIAGAFGTKSSYRPLPSLPSEELKKSKNIVLIVLDGLGFEYIKNRRKNTILGQSLRGSITSVFPSTTASAIPTFETGTAPQQHAFTGWFMHLKEFGVVSTILPFRPRMGGNQFSSNGVNIEDVLDADSFSDKLGVESYSITREDIMDSAFTKAVSGKSKILGYSNLNGFFMQIKKAINSHNNRKYIYAYWSEFDSLSHKHGIGSKEAEKHFREIEKGLRKFVKNLGNNNNNNNNLGNNTSNSNTTTTLIITADHGLIDTTENRCINLEKHPKLKECLTLPLCGEPRAAYCYVHPSKAKQFENYVNTKLKKFCTMHKGEELIRKNYFGLFKANPKLSDRVGDYVLIMKENYILKDYLFNGKKNNLIGNHGGVSKEEMLVPLIVINS